MSGSEDCYALRGIDLLLQLRVQPRATPEGFAGLHGARLRLRIGAAPVDGAANSRLIVVLAKTLHVERSRLKIVRGETSRDKDILIVGGAGDALATLRKLLGSVEKA